MMPNTNSLFLLLNSSRATHILILPRAATGASVDWLSTEPAMVFNSYPMHTSDAYLLYLYFYI